MRKFKTESKRLLDLMINSIYTNREIFLRELISNASDAVDKLYFKSLTDPEITISKDDLNIQVTADKNARTLTIADTGLGMSQERCEEVAAAMKEHRTAKIGIGLGNIYKRVHMMYQKGDLRIYSREGKGTVIQLMIPQGEEKQGEEVYVPTADRR